MYLSTHLSDLSILGINDFNRGSLGYRPFEGLYPISIVRMDSLTLKLLPWNLSEKAIIVQKL